MARTPRDKALEKALEERSLRMMLLPGAAALLCPPSIVASSMRGRPSRQCCLWSTHAMMRTQGGREAHHEGQHKEWSQEGETALDTADHSSMQVNPHILDDSRCSAICHPAMLGRHACSVVCGTLSSRHSWLHSGRVWA